jgi:hypothetical protein
VPSLSLDVEHTHYASFDATLANLITEYDSESLGHSNGSTNKEPFKMVPLVRNYRRVLPLPRYLMQ